MQFSRECHLSGPTSLLHDARDAIRVFLEGCVMMCVVRCVMGGVGVNAVRIAGEDGRRPGQLHRRVQGTSRILPDSSTRFSVWGGGWAMCEWMCV
jgi:hypothetical protein